ncbi:MAG: tetratricopeptide (TPR) repeat protein [Kiritimatiellia bacterium]|jgi:tetratricopeptide (TPR) repeat protein
MPLKALEEIEASRAAASRLVPRLYDIGVSRLTYILASPALRVLALTTLLAMAANVPYTHSLASDNVVVQQNVEYGSPVLVQSHQAFVSITGRQVSGTQTWKISLADPSRADGVNAPPGFDDASDKGARISGGKLRLPDGMTKGTVLTFKAKINPRQSPFAPSGSFQTAPGLPTARAELVVRGVNAPVSLWTDNSGVPTYRPGPTTEVRVVWTDVEPDHPAEAIWSTEAGWLAAGEALNRQVDKLITTNVGRVLGHDVDTLTPARAAERVFAQIKLIPGPDQGWLARPARHAIHEGRGTRAERGAVLISVLRAAGYDAKAGLYRPASLPGNAPATLAAPSLLPRAIVAVPIDDDIIWIDPGAPNATVPALPADLTGAVAWLPGDLPRRIEASGEAEGQVNITGQATLNQDGSTQFTVNITASGVAQEFLRDRLGKLIDADRATALKPFISAGRPNLKQLTLSANGLGNVRKPIRITLHGQTSEGARALASGLSASKMPPLLAPALAGWLPPRVIVHEELAVLAPPGMKLFSVVQAPRTTHPNAVISRTLRRESDRTVLITQVERPYRHSVASRREQARATLKAAARHGPELLHLGYATTATIRRVRSIERAPADRVAIEAMLWWRMGKYRKARKLISHYIAPVGVAELDRALNRYGAAYELRRDLVNLAATDEQLLATIHILVEQGRTEEAWARADAISHSRIVKVQVESRIWMHDLQPDEPPDPATDPERAARWRSPMELLDEAQQAAQRAGEPNPTVLSRKAEIYLTRGRLDEAKILLQQAKELTDDPLVAIMLAEAGARSGDPLDGVRVNLQEAVSRASSDPDVLTTVSNAYASFGETQEAFDRALAAARLGDNDASRWALVVERAMDAGQLSAALHAAHTASGLALTDKDASSTLTRVATLAGDQQLANLGWNRGGEPLDVSWPPDIATLIGLVPEKHLLALLRHHDGQVLRNPALLSLRAQLEVVRGDRSRAARDGTLLYTRHDMPLGAVVAFAAGLGKVWQANPTSLLDRIAHKEVAARSARLEHRAIMGGSIANDLRSMKDDPRAKIWNQTVRAPSVVAVRDPDWKPGPPPRATGPSGFKTNPVLSSIKGVQAWSNSVASLAVVRFNSASSQLPPPLSLLYSVRNPPLMTLDHGGHVVALEGGSFPIYAAIQRHGDQHILGLGYSPEAAARALASMPPL